MLPKLVRFDRDVRLGTGLMAGEVLAPAVVGHIYRRAPLAVAAADRDVIAAISDATAVIDLHDHDHATAGTLAGLETIDFASAATGRPNHYWVVVAADQVDADIGVFAPEEERDDVAVAFGVVGALKRRLEDQSITDAGAVRVRRSRCSRGGVSAAASCCPVAPARRKLGFKWGVVSKRWSTALWR